MKVESGLLELAAKCEKATEPDRELDCGIAVHFGWRIKSYGAIGPVWRNGVSPPDYTTSLDAAMTLVPEGWTAWQLRSRRRKTVFVATLSRLVDDIDEEFDEEEVTAHAATPALALCAAALRAQAGGNSE
jgi:hypothetical protein